jgi:hypothetical protein
VGQRQVEGEPLALARAALVGMAEEIGELDHRVGVHVDHQHVGALVEDRLRAVAVVVVDVEHRHPPRAPRAQRLRRHRGVVDVAVAAGEGAVRVVARRPAEREGGAPLPATMPAAVSAVSCAARTAAQVPATKGAPPSKV